jgi:hypothetical protein
MLNKVTALDLTFQALADSTRRAILAELTRGPSSVSKLARPLAGIHWRVTTRGFVSRESAFEQVVVRAGAACLTLVAAA